MYVYEQKKENYGFCCLRVYLQLLTKYLGIRCENSEKLTGEQCPHLILAADNLCCVNFLNSFGGNQIYFGIMLFFLVFNTNHFKNN